MTNCFQLFLDAVLRSGGRALFRIPCLEPREDVKDGCHVHVRRHLRTEREGERERLQERQEGSFQVPSLISECRDVSR